MELPPVGQSVRASQLDETRSVRDTPVSTALVPQDTVKISPNSLMVSRMLDQVNAMPETRPESMRELRSKMGVGNYPPPMLVEGLAKLMGGSLSSLLKESAKDSQVE